VAYLVIDCKTTSICLIHKLGNRHWVTRHHKAEQTDETTEYFTTEQHESKYIQSSLERI